MSFRVPFREVWIAPQRPGEQTGLMRYTFHFCLQNRYHVGVSIHAARHGDSVKGLGKGCRAQAPQFGFVVRCHGLGRLGGLGFARRRPCERWAQAFPVDSGNGFKGGSVLSGHKALTLPVIHGLLGDAQ